MEGFLIIQELLEWLQDFENFAYPLLRFRVCKSALISPIGLIGLVVCDLIGLVELKKDLNRCNEQRLVRDY